MTNWNQNSFISCVSSHFYAMISDGFRGFINVWSKNTRNSEIHAFVVLMTSQNLEMDSTIEVQLFVTLIGRRRKKFKVEQPPSVNIQKATGKCCWYGIFSYSLLPSSPVPATAVTHKNSYWHVSWLTFLRFLCFSHKGKLSYLRVCQSDIVINDSSEASPTIMRGDFSLCHHARVHLCFDR